MRSLVRFIDRVLRRRQQVFEFSQRPDCLFRARLLDTPTPLPLRHGEIAAGAPVLELHLWNEHVPALPADGPTLAWAARSSRLVVRSCRELAECLESDPRLRAVQALGGTSALFSTAGHGAERLLERMGFAVSDPPATGRWRAFWDDFHAWALMWAFNQVSVRDGRFRRMRRARFWTTREAFLARHGSAAP